MLEVALSSLWSRRGSVMLTLASLTISMAIVIGVEHIRAVSYTHLTLPTKRIV